MRIARPGPLLPLLAAVAACGPTIGDGPAAAQVPDPLPVAADGDLAPPPPPPPTADDAAETLARARAAYAAGDLDGADLAAADGLSLDPDPETAGAARLLRARIAILRGRHDDARALLAAIRGDTTKYVPGYRDLCDLLAADAAGRLVDGPEAERRGAAERLAALALLPGDLPLAAARLDLLLRLDRALGQRAALVRHAVDLRGFADDPAARRWQAEAQAVLDDPTALTRAEIGALFAHVPRESPLAPPITRRLAEMALADGDLAAATAAADQAAAARPDAAWLADLRARIAAVADVDPGRIGVLIPTSGPSAAIGQRALAAMEIALQPYAGRFALETRDTGGDEAATRAAVRGLAADARVVAVLGPIEARVATAAAAEAAAAGVPLLSLNVQRDVADAADCRFRDYPTYAAEVEALVAYAWDHARGRRFAVLRAGGRYGELLAALAADAVERRGGEIVEVAAYATDKTEFLDVAAEVRRLRPDVVLFADAASRVALLAPALAYEDLWPQPAPHDAASTAPGGPRREALYLLPSAAADPAALADARRYVEGAVAAVGFLPAARAEQRTPFETAFAARHPSGPTQLDAFAHDAARIVATLVEAGAANRPALCRALASAESADTVAPFFGFGADGEARRPVRLGVLRGGALAPLEIPAL